MDILASDLARVLEKGVRLSSIPAINLLNHLWITKVSNSLYDPYEIIISFALQKIAVEKIISDSVVGLSEAALTSIFCACGFKSKKGVYCLDDISLGSENELFQKGMQDVEFNNVNIKKFNREILKQIISLWLSKAESDFGRKDKKVFNQVRLIQIFYSYVQWGESIGSDVRPKLASFVANYLKDDDISEQDKKYLKKIIKNEKDKFDKESFGAKENPMETLFNNNELLRFIE